MLIACVLTAAVRVTTTRKWTVDKAAKICWMLLSCWLWSIWQQVLVFSWASFSISTATAYEQLDETGPVPCKVYVVFCYSLRKALFLLE